MEVKKIFSPFSQILSLMPNMMIVLYTVPDSVKNNYNIFRENMCT